MVNIFEGTKNQTEILSFLFLEFMKFFGTIFLITTTMILFFKREAPSSADSLEDNLTLGQTYKLALKILCLPSVMKLSMITLTCKVFHFCSHYQFKWFMNIMIVY